MTTALANKKAADLVRSLIDQGEATSRSSRTDAFGVSEGEEILFDVEVDGARYLLVRLMKATDDQSARLSPREQEIVRLVALGHSNKIIGDVLNISSWTVCTHLRRIFAKLGVGSRAAMVARISAHRGTASGSGPAPSKRALPKDVTPDFLDFDAEPQTAGNLDRD